MTLLVMYCTKSLNEFTEKDYLDICPVLKHFD